jgi:hypothetical protein
MSEAATKGKAIARHDAERSQNDFPTVMFMG